MIEKVSIQIEFVSIKFKLFTQISKTILGFFFLGDKIFFITKFL